VAQPVRPSVASLVGAQARYAVTEYWRARLVVIFSLFLPLVWLFVIGAVAGNEVIDETGVRVMQFATPVAISMGALYAALPTTATSLARARETGVLMRLRGTPTPTGVYLAGRALGASLFALVAVAAMLVVGVVAYDVRLNASTLVPTVVTLVLAIVTYVCIGLAIAAVARSGSTAEALSIGGVVILSFISGMFSGFGQMPQSLDRIASAFPVKPVTDALQEQFSPFTPASGWSLGAFTVLVMWTAAAAVIARWGLSREPGGRGLHLRRRLPARQGQTHPDATGSADSSLPTTPTPTAVPVTSSVLVTSAGRPSLLAMILGQAGAGLRLTWRDPSAVFFAMLMPVGLFAFLSAVVEMPEVPGDVPATTRNAANMIAWGVAVTAFLNLPAAIAKSRDRGVLKRLRGTPLTPPQLLSGRVATALVVNLSLVMLILGAGALALDLRVLPGGVLLCVAATLLGTLALAALGFVLAAAVPQSRTFGAVALVVLLALGFVSEVLLTQAPAWMTTIGSLFPLRHLQQALVAALDPSGGTWSWSSAAILLGWTVGAATVASRWFRWDSSSH
jgi:ABC-type multidrug transport system permease subunit